jgi:hypothetical protein
VAYGWSPANVSPVFRSFSLRMVCELHLVLRTHWETGSLLLIHGQLQAWVHVSGIATKGYLLLHITGWASLTTVMLSSAVRKSTECEVVVKRIGG